MPPWVIRAGWLLLFLLPTFAILAVAGLRGGDVEEPSASDSTTESTPHQHEDAGGIDDVHIEAEEALVERVIAFEKAFTARHADDTSERYAERIRPYASDEFMDWVVTDISGPPDSTLREQGITVEAEINPREVFVEAIDERAAEVTVNLLVLKRDQHGGIISRVQPTHKTLWGYENGEWRIYPPPL